MKCEICKGENVEDWANVSGFAHYRCEQCWHIFVYPKPSASNVERIYQDASYYKKAECEELQLVAEARSRIGRLSKLANQYSLNKSLLDVGCGSGIFLQEAQRAGWVVEGVELSPVLCAKARSKGLMVREGWIESTTKHSRFSVVTAWEVIEHAIDPAKFLDDLRSYTKQGGLVALSTPLGNGIPATVLQSRFPFVNPPEHLCLFSRKSITMLGQKLGLELIKFRSFSNLKKDNIARGLSRFIFGRLKLLRGSDEKLAFLLALPILPVCKVMDALGIGSEMEVVFRRTS